MKGIATCALAVALAVSTARAQEEAPSPAPSPAADEALPAVLPGPADFSPSPSTGEKPSAELILDAAEPAPEQPAPAPDDSPLPPLDKLPGEDNLFGDDLFGPGENYAPSMPEMPAAPPIVEDAGEVARKLRVKFRTVRARLLGDPDLVALQESADRAPTPEDRRAARRAYYALLFKKVRKADSSLADYADKLEAQSVAILYQTRIEPTVPLNPPPEPQPDARFVPAKEFPDATPDAMEPGALP